MARQVNTRFVLTLAAVLTGVSVVIIGILLWQNHRKQDPAILLPLADEALSKGDTDGAIGYLTRALPGALSRRMPNCENIAIRIGNLYYDTSTDGVRYSHAMGYWQQALIINPNCKEAVRRLLEEYALNVAGRVPFLRADWALVEKYADQLATLDPSVEEAYVNRAEAILNQLEQDQSKADVRLADVDKDLQQALKLNPKDAKVCSLMVHVILIRSQLVDASGKKSDHDAALKLKESARKLVADFCTANPKDPDAFVDATELHIMLKEYMDAETALKTAMTLKPDNLKTLEIATRLHAIERKYQDVATDLAEQIKLKPDDLALDLSLGSVYQENLGDITNALESYKKVFSLKPVVTGFTMVSNEKAKMDAQFQLPWCYLDAAEQAGPATVKGKALLVDAQNAIGPLRQRIGSNTPGVDLLEGRASYLKNQLLDAIPSLRRADEGFSAKENRMVWVRCKYLLADAYARQTEYGNAMKYIDDILQAFPQWIPAKEQKISLLLHIAQYDEALKMANDVLHDDEKNHLVLQMKVKALEGLGKYAAAQELLKVLQDNTDDFLQASLQLAQMQLISNEPDEVVLTLIPVLNKYPDNQKAILYISMALIKLHRSDEAKNYLQKGLAKTPDNLQMKMILAQLDNPDAPLRTVEEDQIKLITDEFDRNWAYAQLYAADNDYKNELKSLQECERVRGDSTQVIERIFSLALRQKDWDLAQTYTQRAISGNLDGAQGKLFEGRYQYAKGDKELGLETLRGAVAQRDDYSMGWTILGQAYADMRNTTEAIKSLETAVNEKPDNIYALRTLIALYINQHDDASLRTAEDYLTRAMVFAPRDPEIRKYDDILKPQEAIPNREQLRKVDPKNVENLKRLAALYSMVHQSDKAIDVLQDLAKQHPEDLQAADSLARLYRDNDRTNDAIKLYEPFLASSDADTQYNARLLLGDMQRSMSQVTEAIGMYREAASKEKSGTMDAERRLADLYFELEDMPQSGDLYQKIYQNETTKDIRVLRRYVETLIRQDKYKQANDLLDSEVFKAHPDDAEGLVLRGYGFLRQHKAREALDCFDKVLAVNPNNTDALHYRAYTNFVLMNDHSAAIDGLLRVREITPQAINSRLLLARVYYAEKQFPEAAHEYQEVLKLRPDMVSIRLEYAEMLLNITQIFVQMPKDSTDTLALRVRAVKPVETLATFLMESSRLFPKQSAWPIMLGNLYGMTGDVDRAVEIHKAAFINSGKNLQIGITYINTLMNLHRYEEANAVINDLLEVNISVELYARRGATNAALKHVKEAKDDFTHAFDMIKDVNSLVSVARQCYAALGADDATSFFQARIDKNPKDYLSRLGLGSVHSSDGNSKAVVSLVMPLLTDTTAVTAKPVALRMLAMADYQLKDFDKSLLYYQQLIEIMPDDLEVLNNIAYLLANDMKRPEEGLKYAERARQNIEDRPIESSLASYSNVMDTVGWVKFLADDMQGASDDFQRSLQMNPLPICYYHLAVMYQKQHRFVDAKAAAEQCIKLGMPQKDPVVASAQALLTELKKAPPA